jgi:predicted metalloendopeptidase
MKRLIPSTVYASILLLTACNQTAEQLSETTTSEASAPSVLVSGITQDNIDKTVRPQDNFYRYVNGGWIKRSEIPNDKTAIGSFYDLRDEADSNVKVIIEELAKRQHLIAGSDEQKVGDLFNSYMNMEIRNKAGIAPLQSIIDAIDNLKTKQDIAQFFGQYQAIGITTPFAFYISVDAKDSNNYATHIWQGGLGLPDKDYYFNEEERFVKLRQGYLAHIEKMFDLASFPKGSDSAKTIMSMETKLAKHHWTRVQSRDSEKRYNKFAVTDLSNSVTNHFDWVTYLDALGVSQQKDLIVNQPDYVSGFGNLFAETSVSDWQTYLRFHMLSAFAPYLTAELDQENFNFFSKQLNGRKEQRPQWKRGVATVNANLGEVIGKVYVAKHFVPQAKLRMSELVENLRNAYGNSIDELEWMSEDTKKSAHIKLAAFTPKIGYPDKWEDYSALKINSKDIIGNIIRSGEITHRKEISKLGGPIRHWEWGMTPQTVNAYYNPTVNEIVFPAAILQPPFFNMAADDAVNYGGIGAVIGHEMGHGFDDQGSKYDAKGNLRNWWSKADLKAFKKRTDNLVTQYNHYAVFSDLHVNGKLTLGENIGDLSGVTIAYKAYKASLNGKDAPIIDGLTGDQRFFMGYTQIWRSKIVEKSMRNRVATDPHSPGEYRALGSLSNVPEFYKAFNVKEGDKMYISPEKRVKIW